MFVLFSIVALLYASAGFGGGSTYTALLALGETPYTVVPIVSLICNIVVVAGGAIHFARQGLMPWRQALPLVALSIPASWIGGALPVSEVVFMSVLAVALLVSAILMWCGYPDTLGPGMLEPPKMGKALLPGIGAGVGFLSGLVGIGGGIFLAPILYLCRWGPPKRIAATASLFILCNSFAGLAGQVQKNAVDAAMVASTHWPLVVAVLVGGQIGSHLGASVLKGRMVRWATAALVFMVAIRLLFSVLRRTIIL